MPMTTIVDLTANPDNVIELVKKWRAENGYPKIVRVCIDIQHPEYLLEDSPVDLEAFLKGKPRPECKPDTRDFNEFSAFASILYEGEYPKTKGEADGHDAPEVLDAD